MYSAESEVLEEESWETFTPSEPSEPFEPSGPPEPSGTSGTFTPSEPSDPFEPSGPSEPSGTSGTFTPSEPSEPFEPSGPSEPSGTSGTFTPSEPSDPFEPSGPSEPSGTSGTFTPSEPSDPFEPSGPSEPSGTSGTFTPSEPSEPFEPSGPSEPSGTSGTFTPSEPSDPFEPSGPSEPSGTSGTFTPSEPSDPFEPSGPCGTFSDGSKPKKPVLSTELRRMYRLCRRRVFSSLVASKQGVAPHTWSCCAQSFHFLAAVHQHVSRMHGAELQQQAEAMLHQLLQHQQDHGQNHGREPEPEQVVCAWLPDISHLTQEQLQSPPGKVLLFYHYCHLDNPQEVCAWQRALCERLQLTGKVRVATEGLNGSVGGSVEAAALYVRTMMSHPMFRAMEEQDFKSSEGGAECFPDLKVKVHQEIVPMGIPPDVLSFQQAGPHLNPECFHQEVQDFLSGESRDTLLLDCRNFYESRIGRFQRSLAPDIRKFSYFPDYVDQNLDLFRDKKVLMYCTGGVRCERASAYLRSKGVCREVFQLGGGILCYLQRFPHGFYRGKLFVFDERYALCWNQDVIAACRFCGAAWDQYQRCSSPCCSQLLLSCASCRREGRTACCDTCSVNARRPARREECECTARRPRIPRDLPGGRGTEGHHDIIT